MAKLYVSEFSSLGMDHRNISVPAPLVPGNAEHELEIGLEQVVSEPFKEQTRFIIVKADAACHLGFGALPRADQRFHKLSAGETRFYSVHHGDRIAVIEAL